ncbi:GNAT family N-acetyltransferase [Agarivorans aestuarii]|uniref:GNAT family N-acetyltransferase n=1 Tax=Agarivorans aestuarii TaxID=1563703 RepID=UPI001C80C3FE|nr:GNAT family N-acetyltransferase [Agarivorans aestuarii]
MRECIRDAKEGDSQQICQIYNYYVETSGATFEEQLVSQGVMAERIVSIQKQLPWLVFEEAGEVLGYAYVSPWKERSAYRFAVESSIYVAQQAAGKGIGNSLYQALLARLVDYPIATVIAGITLPNPASIVLHERLGFNQVAEFERVGFKFGNWMNVGYWQRQIKTEEQINHCLNKD